ncbi:Retrovirus-related Pol polyprotein from transposon [Trichinella sp. T6]|nr:Retrovirus-related Pol polyprotein from transposon [Trichinella sp. T6]
MLCSVWALREFLSYIYGQRFLLRTDRSFLRWMTTFKEPEGQVARWLARVRSQFYWPGMSGDVHTWCRTCTQCTKRKAPTKNNVAPMQAMAARYPLQRVGIDILGPLEKSPSENRCVQVLMDYFNKWSAAFSLANMEASTVAHMLVENYIAYFGAHDYLPSDQGRSFKASEVLEMRQLFGIKKTRSFPYHPQGNVQAEKFTRALLDMLSIMFDRYPGQYDDMLPFDMLANNRSDCESPGVTPAIAMLDRAPSLALSPRAAGLHPRDPRAYRPCARAGEGPPEDAATSPNCLHDQHAKELRFSLNDRMWLAMPRRGKLDREWEGPYQVVEVMGPQTYRVRHHERNRSTLVVHSYQIQRYHAKDTIELPDEGEPSVRDGTTRRKKHQPPGAASPPSSEMRVETPAQRRPPPGYLRDYIF